MSASTKRAVAASALLLFSPAAFFIAMLFLHSIQSQEMGRAYSASRVLMWYVGLRQHAGLLALLIALPLTVLGLGVATLFQERASDAELRDGAQQTLVAVRHHMATVFVALATFMTVGILAIVVTNLLTN